MSSVKQSEKSVQSQKKSHEESKSPSEALSEVQSQKDLIVNFSAFDQYIY